MTRLTRVARRAFLLRDTVFTAFLRIYIRAGVVRMRA